MCILPGTPGYRVSRPTNEDQKISAAEQSLYQLDIGMLLYLVKHSRPDIINAVHECTKVQQIIKYVLDTNNCRLSIDPTYEKNEPWNLVCYSDSNYA